MSIFSVLDYYIVQLYNATIQLDYIVCGENK